MEEEEEEEEEEASDGFGNVWAMGPCFQNPSTKCLLGLPGCLHR